MGKHKRSRTVKKNTLLPDPVVPDDKKTRFSFEKLDAAHPTFNLSRCGEEFWKELVKTLRDAEAIPFDQFVDNSHSEARHGIDFDKTIAPQGFSANFDSDQLIPFQFPVPLMDKARGWRVYGYYANRLFYIVWLDVCHALYKVKAKTDS